MVHSSQNKMLPEVGLASPSFPFCPITSSPRPGTPHPTGHHAAGAAACSITRAVPTFITSSVLSPPPSLLELLGLAVPLASLGGS